MSDIQKTPPESTPVIDMPWVLISNQIQQLNENMNQRFNDERLRMDDRFAAQERSLNDRFAAIDQRLDKIDQRMDQMDQRFDKLEHRLEFRVSTWLAIILAALTLIIGVLLGHPVSW